MELEKISFSTNWNKKLDCDVFTTLRLDSNKYEVGKLYTVFFKRDLKTVRVLDKKALLIESITEWIAQLDTGYSRQECINIIKRMYSSKDIDWTNKKLMLLLLKTEK